MKAKPDKEPFLKFLELSGCSPETCVSIGDRFDIDLEVPLEMGMGAIMVNGVSDVYCLGELFVNNR
jgi:phosphoglycolate phosphatase/putative hydrolase of the HAD superfamily